MSNFENFLYENFSDVEKNDMEYIYRGGVTPKLVMNFLDFAKSNLAKSNDTNHLKQRIYYIMGEGLQNITRHQSEKTTDNLEDSAIVVILKKNYKFYIATGNLMNRSDEKKLTEKLEHINSLNAEELKELCRETRITTEISSKGGASLGLIEMAKRSGNKLSYLIKPVNDELSYFYLNTEIPTSAPQGAVVPDFEYSLKDLTATHKFLNDNNYILSFKGDFNQENLLSLLGIVKNRMNETTTIIKLHSVMIELVQNIVKHADNPDTQNKWTAGIFYLAEQGDKFTLLAGNYVKHTYTEKFSVSLDRINSMDYKELTSEYNRILFSFEDNDPVTTGLGIIDIRRKCGGIVKYDFRKINNDFDFFTVQVDISKKQ